MGIANLMSLVHNERRDFVSIYNNNNKKQVVWDL